MKNFLKAAFAAGIFTMFCGATPVTSLTEGYFTFSNFTCTNIYNAATDCAGYTLYGVGGGFENGVAQGVLIVFDRVAGGNAANPDLFSLSYEVTYTGPYDASDLPLHFSEEYDTAPPNTFT